MTDDKQKKTSVLKQPMQYDIALLFPVLFLVGIGIVMVYSASSALALKKFGTSYYFLKKQSIFALLGIVVLVISCHVPYHIFRSLTYPLLILAVILLFVILISGFGYSAGGAKRWFRIAGFTFQPSEFARFVLVIYLAYSMNKKMSRIKEFKVGFLPHVLVLIMFTVLIM
ncbi:MAG: FtsW/RodA/SpoVE family cell cycle protein, partial [Desulfobacterales bacterium]